MMIDFEVSRDEDLGAFVIRGDFDPNAIAIAIPNSNANRRLLSSFFLHKADLESCMRYLACVSIDKSVIVNEALFVAGLNSFLKCFKHSAAREKLVGADIYGSNQAVLDELNYFESLRDKHFIHDENGMLQTTEFFLLSPESNAERIEHACVLWNKTPIDYYAESERLKHLLDYTYPLIRAKIDDVSKIIIEEYKDLPRDELLKFGDPKVKLASKQDISRNRI